MKQIDSPSYMELRLDLDEKQGARYLRIPTFWDSVAKKWTAVLKLSDGKLVPAIGKDSFELQNNFNIAISDLFHDDKYSHEVFNMFKPLEYWERKE